MPDAPTIPTLPGGALPPTPLLLRWLAHAADQADATVRLDAMPDGNGSLPDLCRLAGVQTVVWSGAPRALRWEGWGGGRVTLLPATGLPAEQPDALHCGPFPAQRPDDGRDPAEAVPLLALLDLARLEDAASFLDRTSDGAAWDSLLDVLGHAGEARHPPVAALTGGGTGFPATLWNPLPFRRTVLAAMPAGDGPAPWSLTDAAGGRHPVQVAEGPMGPEWLVAATIPGLGGLALSPSDDTAPGAHWEVSESVIDNGRVRAELDSAGRIVRLCCDGVFAELTGPALEALVDGVPWSAPMSIFVAEDGPVRARVIASGGDAKGTLSLAYTLIAGEDCLRITASWSGDAWCELDIPTAHRASDLHLGAGLARWSLVQRISALGDGSPASARGVRWAALGDASGRGLALVAGRPIAVAAQGGHVYLPLEPSATVALAAARRVPGALSLSHLAEHLAAAGRRVDADAPPPPIRMAETAAVVPLWARRGGPDAGRDDGELLLAETAGARGRIHLYPPTGLNDGAACWRVDAHGRRLAPVGTTPESDGWQVDLAPGEVCLVRWTAPPAVPVAEEFA